MRNILAILLLLGAALLSGSAQQFRIATWQVPDIEMSGQTTGVAAREPAQIKGIGAVLSAVDADVIVLYGLSDEEALKRIGDSMQPKKYSVAAHSVFRFGTSRKTVVGQSLGMLSRNQRMVSKKTYWTDTGRIDLPGGFTFVTFRHGKGGIGVYVANMPGSLTNGVGSTDGDYFSRKRGYAAEYLAHHASWLATTYAEQPFATYLTGDFNLAPKKPVKDDCADLLEKVGFRAISTGNTLDKTTLAMTNTSALNRIFDPVFTKGVEFISSRQVARPTPEQPIVICDVTLSASPSASILSPSRRSAQAPQRSRALPDATPLQPAPIEVVNVPPVPKAMPPASQPAADAPGTSPSLGGILQQQWIWPAAGGIAFALLAFVVMGVRRSRRRSGSKALSRRTNESVFVEMNSPVPRPQKPRIESGSRAVLSEPTTATDNAHNVIWQKSSVRIETGTEADETRAGLMPHLKRLMREKLFVWLSHQRTQLIDSHETGTQKVLGLEERLEKIQDQFQDRLIEQQQRIAELDKELQAKEKLISENLKEKSKEDKQRSNN